MNDAIAASRDILDALCSSLKTMSKLASVDTIEMTRDVKAMSRPGLQGGEVSLKLRRNSRYTPFPSSKAEDDLAWIEHIGIEFTI